MFLHALRPHTLTLTQEFRAVLCEWDVGLCFGQRVGSEFRSLEVFQIYHMSVDLLNHIVDSRQKVLAALVVP